VIQYPYIVIAWVDEASAGQRLGAPPRWRLEIIQSVSKSGLGIRGISESSDCCTTVLNDHLGIRCSLANMRARGPWKALRNLNVSMGSRTRRRPPGWLSSDAMID
jgi:hypothetical protein